MTDGSRKSAKKLVGNASLTDTDKNALVTCIPTHEKVDILNNEIIMENLKKKQPPRRHNTKKVEPLSVGEPKAGKADDRTPGLPTEYSGRVAHGGTHELYYFRVDEDGPRKDATDEAKKSCALTACHFGGNPALGHRREDGAGFTSERLKKSESVRGAMEFNSPGMDEPTKRRKKVDIVRTTVANSGSCGADDVRNSAEHRNYLLGLHHSDT